MDLDLTETRLQILPTLVENPRESRHQSGCVTTPIKPQSAGFSRASVSNFGRQTGGVEEETFLKFKISDNVSTKDLNSECTPTALNRSSFEPLPCSRQEVDSGKRADLVLAPSSGDNLRLRAEQVAEYEVEHNWVLKEETAIRFKKFNLTKRKLAIFLPDDDPLEDINSRLEEVQSMIKPKVNFSTFFEELPAEQREKMLTVTPSEMESLARDRKRNWKPKDRIHHAFRLVFIMTSCFPPRRYFNTEDPDAGPVDMNKQRKVADEAGRSRNSVKSSLSFDMYLALTTRPQYRTSHHLKRIEWVLRATKAFHHLFPSEMEREVAKVVAYERYDDSRHICYQERLPERFLYVLSGRIQRVREYRLTAGCVNKGMGFLIKGTTTDPEELEEQWFCECHLVAKGPVEVLILQRDDFMRLQHTVQGPPIDFLRSIDLFKEFPCEQFLHNPDAIEFKYYGQNRIIARDVNKTPWLHVIKSGFVKVVRMQYVIDVRHEKKFASQSTEELGYGRSFSHAKAMLGLLDKQRRMKTIAEISLPGLSFDRPHASIGEDKRKRRKSRTLQGNASRGEIPVITVDDDVGDDPSIRNSPSHSEKTKSHLILPPINQSVHEPASSSSINATQTSGSGNGSNSKTMKGTSSVPRLSEASIVMPHGTFLTREFTQGEGPVLPPGVTFSKKPKKEPLVRRAYLQLDVLQPGDVFGLEDIAEKFRYHQADTVEGLENLDATHGPVHEGPAISLVSDGAEVIKMSKRFFLQHAQNNTMLRVETMQRSYLSTEEAKAILYDKETWTQYKAVLMQRLVDALPR